MIGELPREQVPVEEEEEEAPQPKPPRRRVSDAKYQPRPSPPPILQTPPPSKHGQLEPANRRSQRRIFGTPNYKGK